MVETEAVGTAIDRGYEKMAQLQLDIAKNSRLNGDVQIFDRGQILSVVLLANITALESLALHHSFSQDKTIYDLLTNIKAITKDFNKWN